MKYDKLLDAIDRQDRLDKIDEGLMSGIARFFGGMMAAIANFFKSMTAAFKDQVKASGDKYSQERADREAKEGDLNDAVEANNAVKVFVDDFNSNKTVLNRQKAALGQQIHTAKQTFVNNLAATDKRLGPTAAGVALDNSPDAADKFEQSKATLKDDRSLLRAFEGFHSDARKLIIQDQQARLTADKMFQNVDITLSFQVAGAGKPPSSIVYDIVADTNDELSFAGGIMAAVFADFNSNPSYALAKIKIDPASVNALTAKPPAKKGYVKLVFTGKEGSAVQGGDTEVKRAAELVKLSGNPMFSNFTITVPGMGGTVAADVKMAPVKDSARYVNIDFGPVFRGTKAKAGVLDDKIEAAIDAALKDLNAPAGPMGTPKFSLYKSADGKVSRNDRNYTVKVDW